MDLSLTSIYPLVNSGCPNCQVNGSFAKTELAPFSADCIEHHSCLVDSVVIEFDVDLSRSIHSPCEYGDYELLQISYLQLSLTYS